MTEKKYYIVGAQFPGEDGITKKALTELINECDAVYLDTLRIEGENSAAIFVFNSDIYSEMEQEDDLYDFIKMIKQILNDTNLESENNIYEFRGMPFRFYYA